MTDFVHPHWSELFDGPEAYLAWRETQHTVTFTAEWNAVQAATLTPDQERAVHRGAHLAVFGTEPPAGKPIDFRKAFPGETFTL